MTEKSLEQSVREWLETEGYPLEIRVAREFRTRGFNVQQSEYYKNDEGIFREIDVLAAKTSNWDEPSITTLFQIEVVLECKGFPARPWVVFSAPLDEYTREHRRDHRIATRRGFDLLITGFAAGELSELEFFRPNERAGYSVVPAFKGNDDAYKAVTAVADAAHGRATQWSGEDFENAVDLFGIYFPVVVIGAPLFECFEDGQGKLHLVERDHVPLYWRRSMIEEHEFTVIDLVTERGLPAFIERLALVQKTLDATYSSQETRRQRALQYMPPRDDDDDEHDEPKA